MEEFETSSCIRGYHVYQDRWVPIIGEWLECTRQPENPRDRYAIAVCKGAEIVGHVPRYISTLCSLFIRRGGTLYAIVLGGRQYPRDLVQGGMEVPCRLHFVGNGGELKKVKSFYKAIPSIPGGQPVSTNTDQPTMNSDQPTMNSDQQTMNCDQPEMNSDQPTMNSDQLQPVMNIDYLGESAKNYHCDQPSASKEESISTAVVLKQPISDANKKQPQISLNGGALEPSKSTTQSNQFSSPQPEQSAVWATFERCVLLVSDKVLIENGEELTDKHMQFTQCMIKKQFPSIGGLYSTLLQDKPPSFRSRTANTIQVVHCKKRKHWITTSTKWCKDNQVAVYDSVFVRLDAETRTTIMKIFRLKKTKDIIMMPMQKQDGSTDCGVFAIAVMTSLAYEEDPSRVEYNQMQLREHLSDCITKGNLVCFPKQ